MANINLELEKEIIERGYVYIAGIDEAGRGPWAGPVVAAAVVYPEEVELNEEVDDSKKLTQKKRERLYEKIKSRALTWGLGVESAVGIDKYGISEAVRYAMTRAVHDAERRVGKNIDYLIVDGAKVRDIEGYEQRKIDRADQIYYSVASASIIAKVYRDQLMHDLDKQYPNYGFSSHKGYGTKQHSEALKKYGPTKYHRLSYKPVAKVAKKFNFER